MKNIIKYFFILMIFLCIFSVVIYYFIKTNNKEKNEISKEQISNKKEIDGLIQDEITDYIKKIYIGSGVVEKEEVFPEFNEINDANDNWILNCLYVNLFSDEFINERENNNLSLYTKNEVNNMKEKLFGENLTKKLPEKDAYENITLQSNGDYYLAARSFEPDYIFSYVIDNMEYINKNEIKVTLLEYKHNLILGEESDYKVFTRDGDEVLYKTNVSKLQEESDYINLEKDINKFVLKNKNKFSTAHAIVKVEKDKYYIKSIER